MKIESKKNVSDPDFTQDNKISRRGLWPLLAGSILIPFLGMGNTKKQEISGVTKDDKIEYDTLLKPDGTVVKVKKTALSSSKIVKKNMSNKSLLNWLTHK